MTATVQDTKRELQRATGRLGAATRHHQADLTTIEGLRAEITRLKLTEAVQEAIASAPPITPEAAVKIADLLVRGTAGRT